MQKKKTIFMLLLVVVFLMVILINDRKNKVSVPASPVPIDIIENEAIVVDGKYEPQTDREEGIEVVVKPKLILEGGENVFEISMNNHIIDLDYDFAQISTLTDGSGEIYAALEWKGPRGGHHVEGELVFAEIKKDVKSLELKIAGIAGVDRLFKWEIK